MQQNEEKRLLTLDALRGIAALVVVAFHCADDIYNPAPSGYLAVDFFFILSGLVLGRAYTRKLETNLSVFSFVKTRLIRLYPLFLLGLSIDCLRSLINVFRGRSEGFGFLDILAAYANGLLMLPSAPKWEVLYRLNSPAWSLAFEIAVNILFALVLYRLRTFILSIVASAAFVFMIILSSKFDNFEVGWTWATLAPGSFRTIFGFCVGMLIGRMQIKTSTSSWAIFPMVAALLAIMVVPPNFALHAVFILAALPVLVYFGAKFNPPAVLAAVAVMLGEISYPMYAIHWPLFYFFRNIGRSLHLPAPLNIALVVTVVAVFGYLANRYFDVPIRNYIANRKSLRKAALA